MVRCAARCVRALLCLSLCVGSLCAQAQATSAAPRADTAVPVNAARLQEGESITLDGRLNHPAWARAAVHERFFEHTPQHGSVPAYTTRVRVLYDARALYVGVDALDPKPELIRAPLVRRDAVNRTQDFIVLYLDGVGQRRSAQFFRINAAGSVADGMHTAADDGEDFSPDFDFDAAAARHDRGWSAVFRIPFSTLRYTDAGAAPWKMMVARRVPREHFHLLTSVRLPLEAGSFIDALQPLAGVQLQRGEALLTLRPSLTLRRETQQANGQPARRESQTEASLDVKWRPLSELVLDGTLRPDFSQVALDVPQLRGNRRFALSFPEKRPFFFESSDLLRSPTDALYTRSLTEPRWGLRGTWRGAGVQGSAFAIDDKGGGFTLLPNAYGTDVAQQPASRTLAGRVQVEAGALSWGALLAARRYDGARGDNQVLGPDLNWQITDTWRMRAQWLQSATSAQSDGQGGLQRGDSRSGHRGYWRSVRQTDDTLVEFTLDDISAGFRHDTGFVYQAGVRSTEGRLGKGWRPLGPFNELWVNLWAKRVQDQASGLAVQQYLTPNVWMLGASNLELNIDYRGLSQLRTAANAALLREHYWKADLTYSPALWIPFLEGSISLGRLADVQANQVRPGAKLSLSMRTRPLAALELEPSFSQDSLRANGRTVYRESALQLLGVWHFNAQHNLRAIVQHSALHRLVEPGIAAQDDGGTVGSLTYGWRHSNGTLFYLGASRSRQGIQSVSRGNEVFVKWQVDMDDARRWWR